MSPNLEKDNHADAAMDSDGSPRPVKEKDAAAVENGHLPESEYDIQWTFARGEFSSMFQSTLYRVVLIHWSLL